MVGQDLPDISDKKYNKWCERRVLVCADGERQRRASKIFVRRDLTPCEKSTFYLHELTDCEGIEFVAFSNAKIENHIIFSNGVVIVPCFISDLNHKNIKDPLVQATMKMERARRFIYDGWAPIRKWDVENVRNAIRNIDEALSLFCLNGRSYFEWEPKYPAPTESPQSVYNYEKHHNQQLEEVAKRLDSLSENDRIAIYRSIAWLNQGLRLNETTARFLFSILAIESLARYIEEEAAKDSPLAVLKAEKLTPTERHGQQEECIKVTLSKQLQENPIEAIKKAYFDCVIGIRRRMETHLTHVFKSNLYPCKLLFESRIHGKSLYELRHVIAHGTVDILSEEQRNFISQRIWDVERVARHYILTVFRDGLGIERFSESMKACLPIGNVVVRSEEMYQGPKHMAIIYQL